MRILKTKEALEIYNKCDEAKNLVKSELKEYIANHEHFEDIGSRMIDVWNEMEKKMRYEEIGKKIKEIRKSKLELELDFKEVGALPVLEDILKEFN